ncbi:single-stranded DNA-binding protein [Streptacidiphilus anmyonensis]|uniref:single-stranded DNA-binding protein n=1 Tax=Streptacidiphilus anmyonensis TaxID=405782 RepID=UPI0005AB3EB5|nr:single-stranded DNA-binding protein [Streptacidiphilus anmyonensis]
MSVGETPITIVGNLTADPEIRFTPAGVALARFTIASTPRTLDKTSNVWKDGTAVFMRCTAWRDIAEHAAESLAKGMRVIATGRLTQHNWDTPEGEKRSMLGMEVEEVGPSLRFANATVTKTTRNGSGTPAQADPWDTPAPANTAPAGAGWGAAPEGGSEPPF